MAVELTVVLAAETIMLQVEGDWNWMQTAKFVEEQVLEDGTLIPSTEQESTLVFLKPNRIDKWMPNDPEVLTQASSTNVDKESSPYMLYIEKSDALAVLVQNSTLESVDMIFLDRAQVGGDEASFKIALHHALQDQHDAKEADYQVYITPGNTARLIRYMKYGHEERHRMPMIHVELTIAKPKQTWSDYYCCRSKTVITSEQKQNRKPRNKLIGVAVAATMIMFLCLNPSYASNAWDYCCDSLVLFQYSLGL